MSSFAIGDSIQGLSIANDVVLDSPSSEVNVSARLTGPVLFLPSTELIQLTCSYEEQSNQRVLFLRYESLNGISFLAGQFTLTSLEVRVRFPVGAGTVLPSLSDPQSVTCQGNVEWRGLPPALGLSGNKLEFIVEYRHAGQGVGAFALRRSQVEFPSLFCRVIEAEITAEPLVSEQAIMVTLSGSASLTQRALDQAAPLLDPVFGNGVTAQLAQPRFFYRQKFRLGPVGLPSIGLLMNWSDAPPPLARVVPGLSVNFAGPRFDMVLPDFNTAPAGFDISFPQCTVRFPGIAGMQAFEIGGDLDIQRNDTTNEVKLAFVPMQTGGVDLPLIVRLLFSRLTWRGGTLDELIPTARRSLEEAEWVDLFRALLPQSGNLNAGPFTSSLRELIVAALSQTSFGAERVFVLVFEAFSGRDDTAQLFGIVWTEWLRDSAQASPAAIANLVRAISSLPTGTLHAALKALFVLPNVDLKQVLLGLIPPSIDFASVEYLRVQLLLVHFIGGLVDALTPAQSAKIIMDASQGAPVELQDFSPLIDPRFVKLDLTFRSITRFIFEALSLIVQAAEEGFDLLRAVLPEIQLPRTERFIQHLMSPVTNLLNELDVHLFPPWSKLSKVLKHIAEYASGDRSREALLLEASRYPISGLAVFVGALLLALERPTPWTGLLGHNIEHLPGLNNKRLPPPFEHPSDPSKSIKYLILSDIHRDTTADDLGKFNFGSIHHFTKNKLLYLEVLEKADAQGYTVIEAGDCEELWFIRDFREFQGWPQLVRDIMAAHADVYSKLRDMHARGRYFRIIGNHDSYLREAEVFEPLRSFMETGNSIPFQLYDFIFIADVKSMCYGVFEFLGDLTTLGVEEVANSVLGDAIRRGVGLDSRPYNARKQMIIAHGHQWDFWNCDEHNLVGKMISNMVGVPLDKLMDPFTDAEGITSSGNPWIDFRELLALPIFPTNNWLSAVSAQRVAHTFQHMNESGRTLNDNLSYCESLVTLSAALGIPLDRHDLQKDAAGQPVLDPQGRPQYEITSFSSVTQRPHPSPMDRLEVLRHYGHLVCVGHTHAPQSMPHFPIARYLLGPGLGDLIEVIRANLPIVSEITFKSGYLNSGTSGWFEGVVWGIEVHETGQPRLVYWTEGAPKPQGMDWELTPWDKDKREQFDQILGNVFPSLQAYLDELVARFGGSILELSEAMLPVFGLPPELLTLLLEENHPTTFHLSGNGSGSSPEDLQSVLLKVFATQQRLATDSSSAAGTHVFTISVDVPAAVETRLVAFQSQIADGLGVPDPLRHAGGLVFALANLERMSRGVSQFPQFSLAEPNPLDALWMVLQVLLLIPNSEKFSTVANLANGKLTVTITLRK